MYKIFPWCHCDTDQRKKKCGQEDSKSTLTIRRKDCEAYRALAMLEVFTWRQGRSPKFTCMYCNDLFSFPFWSQRWATVFEPFRRLSMWQFSIKSALFYNQEHHLPVCQNKCKRAFNCILLWI